MRIERFKKFISQDECLQLNTWVDLAVKNRWLDGGITTGGVPYDSSLRVTSRFYGSRFEYPELAIEVSNRVRQFLGLSSAPLIEGHGKNGIVVSCTFSGGMVYAHKDGRSHDGLATLRCNIMTRASEKGCILHVDGKPIEVEVGELHCYLVSEHEHFVSESEGQTPRVLWMFGAHVPTEDWNSGNIKVGAY